MGPIVHTVYLAIRDWRSIETRESIASLLSMGLTYAMVAAMHFGALIAVSAMLIDRFGLPRIPWSLTTFPLYLIVNDFSFYWVHRLDHAVPLCWMQHSAHHTGKAMTPALIVRGSFLAWIEALVVGFPLLLIGFSPFGLAFCRQITFINQMFCHMEWNWPRFLDRVIVTPRIHRIHHSAATEHLDKNFGGLFSFWDAIFKTKIVEDGKLSYGLHDGFDSRNPLKISFYVPFQVCKTVWKTRNLKYFFVHAPVDLRSVPDDVQKSGAVERPAAC